jgi:hypothetical protein
MEEFIIDQEIQSLLPPLTNDELNQLEANILDGLHVEALVLLKINGEAQLILGDGHHRHTLCAKNGIPFTTRTKRVPTREAAIQWVIDNQLGKRNLTDERRAYYRGKEYLNKKKTHGDAKRLESPMDFPSAQNEHLGEKTAEKVAEKHGVSPATIKRDAEFADAVDQLPPKEKEAVLEGKSGETKQAIAEGAEPIFCPGCKRKMRVGQETPKRCPDCKALRDEAKPKKKTLAAQVEDDLAEPEEDKPDPTPEEIMKEKSSALESFCRKIIKIVEEELPKDEWLDYMDRRKSSIQAFKDACSTVRTAKCYALCPMCKGDGCKDCRKTGRVPKHVYDTLAR